MVDSYDDLPFMQVPEKIVLVEGDKLAFGPETLPEVKFEQIFLGEIERNNAIQLPTPPHILTLDQYRSFVNESDEKVKQKTRVNLFKDEPINELEDVKNQSFNKDSSVAQNNFMNYSMSFSDGDLSSLKRQINLLNHRLAVLENENHQRYQKEAILYALGLVYFTFKAFLWVRRFW